MFAAKLRRLALSVLNLRASQGKKLPVFEPFSPAFRRDPYPIYRELRESDPVHFHPMGVWFVARYAEAVKVWTDPRFVHPPYENSVMRNGVEDAFELMRSNMFISTNPPFHTRIRNIVGEVFTPPIIDAFLPRVQAITNESLNKAERSGRMDLVRDLAIPLPLTVISEMLGLPREDQPMLFDLSKGVQAAMDVAPDENAHQRGRRAAGKLAEYFQTRIEASREGSARNLITRLVAAQRTDPEFSDDEVIATLGIMFIAGHETTISLTGMSLYLLLRDPDQWKTIRENPAQIPRAIEETLRYEPPLQFVGRMASEDLWLGGKRIRKGQTVFILPGAINRDPGQFPDPERFDITREPRGQLAFGHGIHVCVGQYLARAEGAIVLGTVPRRFPNLRLDGEPAFNSTYAVVRGLTSLPVRFD